MCCLERGLNDYSFAGTKSQNFGNRDPVKTSFEEWARLGQSRQYLPAVGLGYYK